jgi:hypothetical protein
MTISEAITRADALYPDTVYTTAQKVAWLYELDGQLWDRLWRLYMTADNQPESYDPADAATQELMIPDPYGEIYALWLVYKYQAWQGESSEANDMGSAYNTALTEYRAWYVRTHKELAPPVLRNWR